MKYFLYFFLFISALACHKEDYSLSKNTDTFFHVKVNKAVIPVWVRGNTASQKIVLYVNSGPGETSIDKAQKDLYQFNDLEKELALAYYDPRGTGNAQGLVKRNTLTLDQYKKDLTHIITVIKAQFPTCQLFIMSHGFGSLFTGFTLIDSETQSKLSGWINLDGQTVVNPNVEWVYKRLFLFNIANQKINLGVDTAYWNNILNWVNLHQTIETDAEKKAWRDFIGEPGSGIIPQEMDELKTGDILRTAFSSSYNIFPAYLSQNQKIAAKALLEDANGSNLISILPKIKIPSLFIWGRYDDIVPPELGNAAFDALGTNTNDAYFELFEHSGRQPFFNEKSKFTQSILTFTQRY